MMGNKPVCFSMIFLVVTAALQFFGCTEKQQEARPVQEIPVKTGVAVKENVPIEISAIGTVWPYSTVSISSHVDGQILQVHVNEGETVKKGEVLFTIDDRTYQATLESVRATLSRNRIQLEKARKDAARYAELLTKDYVTRDQAEQAEMVVKVLNETIKGDEAALKTAQLNLSFCTVTSPIAGRAGSVLVTEGNLIKSSDSSKPLMVINQLEPVYIQFSVPEQYLPEIQTRMAIDAPEVTISLPDKPDETREGRLTFIDNTIDSGTGTILLKATFDNPDSSLWPGQFVNVVLVLGVKTDAVVVPSDAVQMSQDGNYVFIVKADNTVESRTVTTGPDAGDQIVIENGVSVGETVVTDGQLKLTSGARISIKNQTQAGSEVKQ